MAGPDRRAPYNELADLDSLGLAHDHHQRREEGGLEGVISQLVPLQELHGQLPQRVHRVHGHLQVLVAPYLYEEVCQHRPDAVPHQPAEKKLFHMSGWAWRVHFMGHILGSFTPECKTYALHDDVSSRCESQLGVSLANLSSTGDSNKT